MTRRGMGTLSVIASVVLLASCGGNDQPEAWVPPEEESSATETEDTESGYSPSVRSEETEAEAPTTEVSPETATALTSTATSSSSLPPNVSGIDGGERNGDGRCGSENADKAVRENIHKVTPPDWDWDPSGHDTSGYDECAALSWAVVTIHGATASSPFQIMLFHYGEYLGTGTWDAHGFFPTVERVDDSTIDVTYHYPLPGESNMARSGETHATFTWDESAEKVVMTGEVPQR